MALADASAKERRLKESLEANIERIRGEKQRAEEEREVAQREAAQREAELRSGQS